jgi:hypothetical protein
LSPQLVETILQGRQPVELTATESRFATCTSLLTSRAIRRMPPSVGLFRRSPGGHR